MPQIDVRSVLATKSPKLAQRMPRFLVNWLRRTIHEKELNHILANYWELPPQEFIRACFRDWDVHYSMEGLEGLKSDGRYLFVSNHPFGGMDGMMLVDCLMERFGDVRVVVNDLLMNVTPLRPLWVPVNKHGAQNSETVLKMENALFGDSPMLTFPAGLCSRKINGVVTDTEWKISFLKEAYASGREIVPVFVEGHLSSFFYRMHHLRKMLGIKFNIEMLWLVDEMLRQKGKHFRIITGQPISISQLQTLPSLREQAEKVRSKVYELEKNLQESTNSH